MSQDMVKTINARVMSGDMEGAAAMAAQLQPRLVVAHIDYPSPTDEDQPWFDFTQAWFRASDPLNRAEIASWLVNASVADMGYLDVEGEAAAMLARAVRDAVARLAEVLEEAPVLSTGPDAGLTKAQAAEFTAAAAALRAVSLPEVTVPEQD